MGLREDIGLALETRPLIVLSKEIRQYPQTVYPQSLGELYVRKKQYAFQSQDRKLLCSLH